jgi:hypothetical protein
VLSLSNYRIVFVAVALMGVLVCCVPSVLLFAHSPGEQKFSELYVLGPGHMAEGYPFNVVAGVSYLVYVGVGNHMGSSMYYAVYVKFRNATESAPNATTGTPSDLPVLYEYRAFLSEGETWEAGLSFSFSDVLVDGNVSSSVGKIRLNDAVVDVGKTASWNIESNGFYYQLFAELWIYNPTSDGFDYHNRFIVLWLNMTTSQ